MVDKKRKKLRMIIITVNIALFTRGANKDELEALFTSHLKLDRDLASHITIIIRSVST